jgi:hypothetical protein
MGTPYFNVDSGLSSNSDVAAVPAIPILWNLASTNAIDWVEKIYVGRVIGTVRIDGNPAQREIVVVSAQTEGAAVLASAASSASTGAYDISWNTYTGSVLTMLLDDLGTEWTPNAQFAEGSIIYPPAWNGWQYECINSGLGPTDEPTWWAGEGVTAIIGTATVRARQYIPAQVHGLIQPIVEEH